MSDLVRSLRGLSAYLSRASDDGQYLDIPGYSAGTLYQVAPSITEAADRIEQQDKRIERLEAFVEAVKSATCDPDCVYVCNTDDVRQALAELDKETK